MQRRGGLVAVQVGRIGAGTGATIGKWRGREHARPGGLGGATGPRRRPRGERADRGERRRRHRRRQRAELAAAASRRCVRSGGQCVRTAGRAARRSAWSRRTRSSTRSAACSSRRAAHDGLARALVPSHARGDGDAIVAAATGPRRGGRRPCPLPGRARGRAGDPVGRSGRAPLSPSARRPSHLALASVVTLERAGRRGLDVHPLPACRRAHASRVRHGTSRRGPALRRRGTRAPRRTSRDCRSSVVPASCSTGCWSRSSA